MQWKSNRHFISVFHKDGLALIVKKLHELGLPYSTGGTEQFIQELGIPVVPVESVTNYPSILGGRVKTLHPKVFGGILNRQENASTKPKWNSTIFHNWPGHCRPHPFEKPVASGASEQDIIEK